MAEKSSPAQKVLELMDSVENGGDRFSEFVNVVSKESGVPREQIKEELKLYI